MAMDMTLTIPTLAWVLPLVGLVCWAWYRTTTRLWDRYVTPWLLRRLAARCDLDAMRELARRHDPVYEDAMRAAYRDVLGEDFDAD